MVQNDSGKLHSGRPLKTTPDGLQWYKTSTFHVCKTLPATPSQLLVLTLDHHTQMILISN